MSGRFSFRPSVVEDNLSRKVSKDAIEKQNADVEGEKKRCEVQGCRGDHNASNVN